MIIGNGDIASILPESDLLFFASGVSNSQETRDKPYVRELNLLLKQSVKKHIVYFSSMSVFYSDSKYAQHKRNMEMVVKLYFPKYTIVRLGNITWGKNPHTLLNYLRDHPEAEIRDEVRYVIDQEEFLYWIGLIPDWSCEMNLPGKIMTIQEIADYVRP